MNDKIDNLIELAGSKNCYQYSLLLMTILIWLFIDLLGVSLPFLLKPPMIKYNQSSTNQTYETSLNYTSCGWNNNTYEIIHTYSYSWTSEFGVVCDKLMIGMMGTLTYLGVFLGSLVFQYLINNFGRKNSVLIGIVGAICCYTVLALSQSYNLNLVFVCFTEIFICITCMSTFVGVSEAVSVSLRSYFGALINVGYTLCGIVFSVGYKYIPFWRILFAITICVLFLLGIVYYFIAKESPRFFILTNNFKGFTSTLKQIAKVNKTGVALDKGLGQFDQNLFNNVERNPKKRTSLKSMFSIHDPRCSVVDHLKPKTAVIEQNQKQECNINTQTVFNARDVDTSIKNCSFETEIKIDLNETGIHDIDGEKEVKNEIEEKPVPKCADATLSSQIKIVPNIQTTSNNVKAPQTKNKPVGVYALIKYPSIRWKFLALCFMFFCASGNYYGLVIYLKNLPGDIHTNSILIYAFEILAYVIAGITTNIQVIGRKRSLLGFYFIAIVSFIILFCVKLDDTTQIFLTFFGRLGVAAVFNILISFSLEIYPTPVRAQGFGINSAFARIGSMILPFLIELLAENVILIFIFMNWICFVFVFFFPETYKQPLNDKIVELITVT